MLSLHTEAPGSNEVLQMYQKKKPGLRIAKVCAHSKTEGGLIRAVDESQHCPLVVDILIFRPAFPSLQSLEIQVGLLQRPSASLY